MCVKNTPSPRKRNVNKTKFLSVKLISYVTWFICSFNVTNIGTKIAVNIKIFLKFLIN